MEEYTEEQLDELERLANTADFDAVCKYLKELWVWKHYITKRGKILKISTGGFSGHETLIYILEKSMFWVMYWQSSTVGGHYMFKKR